MSPKLNPSVYKKCPLCGEPTLPVASTDKRRGRTSRDSFYAGAVAGLVYAGMSVDAAMETRDRLHTYLEREDDGPVDGKPCVACGESLPHRHVWPARSGGGRED